MNRETAASPREAAREAAAVIGTGVGFLVLSTWLQKRLLFIFAAALFWFVFLLVRVRRDPSALRAWGFTGQGFGRSVRMLLPFGLAALVVTVGYGLLAGTLLFTWRFFLLLALYPAWGLLQQFLIVGLFAGTLQETRPAAGLADHRRDRSRVRRHPPALDPARRSSRGSWSRSPPVSTSKPAISTRSGSSMAGSPASRTSSCSGTIRSRSSSGAGCGPESVMGGMDGSGMNGAAGRRPDWLRLDNAAKIYPATFSDPAPAGFRLSVTLKAPIRVALLAEALRTVLRRCPYYQVHLRRGFFWYYLQRHDAVPALHPMSEAPISAIPAWQRDTDLFRVQARARHDRRRLLPHHHRRHRGPALSRDARDPLPRALRRDGGATGRRSSIHPRPPSAEEYEDAHNRFFDPRAPETRAAVEGLPAAGRPGGSLPHHHRPDGGDRRARAGARPRGEPHRVPRGAVHVQPDADPGASRAWRRAGRPERRSASRFRWTCAASSPRRPCATSLSTCPRRST